MALHYLTSADSGAPALSSTNGALTTVWDWVLNTKSGLTIAYTGTNKRVYSMPNGDVIRVVHDSATSGDARLAVVRAAASASDVDTLADPFPTTTQVADASCNVCVSNNTSSTARPWWALVDTTLGLFVFLIDTSSANFIRQCYIWTAGASNLPVDNYCSLSYARNSSSTGDTAAIAFQEFGFVSSTASGRFFFKRTRDGTIKSSNAALGPARGTNGPAVGNGPAYPDPDDTKLRFARMFAADYYSSTTSAGASSEENRIWIPRVFAGGHKVSGYTLSPTIGQTFACSAYDASAVFAFFPIQSTTGGQGAIILQTAGTWAAPTAL